MKYVKNYSTIAQATADTTAVSPLLAFCSENAQVFNLMGGGIDTPLEITAQNGVISVQEKSTTLTLTIGHGDGRGVPEGGVTIEFEDGMTWRQFVNSKKYNVGGYFKQGDEYTFSVEYVDPERPSFMDYVSFDDWSSLVDLDSAIDISKGYIFYDET